MMITIVIMRTFRIVKMARGIATMTLMMILLMMSVFHRVHVDIRCMFRVLHAE